MQNPGICAKCPIYPEDIVIDPVANTLTITTTKRGVPVDANNPIRFFTDGSGVINKWEKTSPVVFNFTNSNGIWFFHFDNTGTPVATQTPWSDFNTIASVFRFYLNSTKPDTTKIVKRDWEAHLNDTPASDHAWKHAQGTQVINGFDIVANILASNASGVPTTSPNADGRNTCISLFGGKISDDGLEATLINTTTPATVFGQDLGNLSAAALNATNSMFAKIRTNDVDGRLDFTTASRFPFLFNASNQPEYITQAGVRTTIADNRWMVNFVYAFADPVYGECINIMSADQEFTTYALAQAYNWPRIQALYATARDPEVRPLYQLIHYVDRSGGGAYNVGCKYAALVAANDIRRITTTLTTNSGGGASTTAQNVSFIPSGNVSSTNVQDAIVELDTDKVDKNGTDRLMTQAEGTKLEGIASGAQVNVIESLSINGTAVQISNKNVAIVTDETIEYVLVGGVLTFKLSDKYKNLIYAGL